MKKLVSILIGKIAIVILAVILLTSCNNNPVESSDTEAEEGKDMYNEAAMRQQLEFEKTMDPAFGYVPKDRLLAAYKYAEQSKQIAMRSRITAGTWVERGPTADQVGISNGNQRDGGVAVASGRMKAVWVDLSDPSGNTVWAGGIGGGLWKTTNFKTSPATWVPVNDFFTNMAVGSICQDPSNHSIMYFGTGERTSNADAIRGGGVWKSTDNGVNWNLLPSTSSYYNVSKLLCDVSGNLYVGTIAVGSGSGGLFRSVNGGTTFTNISANGLDNRIADFVISSTGRMHVTFGYQSSSPGYRYTDNPSTVVSNSWTSGTGFPSSSSTNQNCILAVNGNTVYAVPSNSAYNVPTIYKSTNGGANWAATLTSPPNTGNTAFSSGQAWYCLAIDVNPTNANNVIVGSLNCYATTDGGNTWTQRSDWVSGVGATGQYVHADIQTIDWYANNQLVIGTDGGIFYSADEGATFQDRNTGLNIKQFYSCAYHPTLANYFLGGTQDNGCHQFTTPGLNITTEITGGDGAYVHIDQNEPSFQYASYIRNRYRRSINEGVNWSGINFYKGTSGAPVNFGSFINATDYDNSSNILYCGGDAGEFFRWSTAQSTLAGDYYYSEGFPSGANILSVSNLTGIVKAVTVSPHTPNRVYLGTSSSKLIRIDNAHTFSSGSAGADISGSSFPAGSTITCIAVGANDNNLMAIFSNYGVSNIWVTTNGGTDWSAIEGNLPDMPVRWAVFDPADNSKAWIATETGVWNTAAINGSSTVWTASPGFPTVRTDMLKYRASDQNLIAATHGRGMWTQSQSGVLPVNTFALKGKWKNNSTVELSWSYSNTPAAASFEIESSTNGTYFIKTGSSQTNTTFLHQPALTDIYYRIKVKNILGNTSYSNVIHLKKGVEIKDIAGLKIFPNPVRTDIKIAFAASGKGMAHYRITGINGQVIWKRDEEISATGDHIREWNMQALKPGNYLFTIMFDNKKITQKFAKF